MSLNNNTAEIETIFNFVMRSKAGGSMFDIGYADAWSTKVIRPQHDNSAYRKGWALGLEYKGK
jgi:hypothetical protein